MKKRKIKIIYCYWNNFYRIKLFQRGKQKKKNIFYNKYKYIYIFIVKYFNLLLYQLPQKYTVKNKIIQIISTKCQYHIANTNPK